MRSNTALAFGLLRVLIEEDLYDHDFVEKWCYGFDEFKERVMEYTVEWAAEAARRGAGEILLTSMDRDGSKDGFDCALTRAVARAVDIPVIASGGVGKLEHFAEGIIDGEADAVLAASVFHFGEFTVRQVKEYMRSQGIPVRL